MPFNGAGVYTPPAADFPVVTQTVISSTHFNNTINDIATALSTTLTRDGQSTATGNIPFGGFRATNIGITGIAGTVGTPAINLSDGSTGFYRSAASEIAVSVAGVQVARFDSTGLIVTGGTTFSGAITATQLTLTTAASRIIPGATSLSLRNNANSADNLLVTDAGAVTVRTTLTATTKVITPIVDSGTTGSLLLQTNNGTVGIEVQNAASAVNYLSFLPGATGTATNVYALGDTNTFAQLFLKGNGSWNFFTGGTGALGTGGNVSQFQVLHTASSGRAVTVTGSNAGSPTVSTTGGGLNLNSSSGSLTFNAIDLTPTTGTFTPSLGGSATYTVQNGNYVKIGNLVFFALELTVNAIGTGSTTSISGMPFTSGARVSTHAVRVNGAATAVVSATASLPGSSALLSIFSRTAANGNDGSSAIFQAATAVQISGCYSV